MRISPPEWSRRSPAEFGCAGHWASPAIPSGSSAPCGPSGSTCGPTSPRPACWAFASPGAPADRRGPAANYLFHGVLFAEPLFQSLPVLYRCCPPATVGGAGLAGPAASADRPGPGRPDRGPGARLVGGLGAPDASAVAARAARGRQRSGPRPGAIPAPPRCSPPRESSAGSPPGWTSGRSGPSDVPVHGADLVRRRPGAGHGDAEHRRGHDVIGQLADRCTPRWWPTPTACGPSAGGRLPGVHSVTVPQGSPRSPHGPAPEQRAATSWRARRPPGT